jgi:isochorismate synthase
MIIKRTLANCLHRNLTFAAFRLDGHIHLWVSQRPGLEEIPWEELETTRDVFILAPFFYNPARCTILRPSMRFDLTEGDDLDRLTTAKGGPGTTTKPPLHWEKEAWLQAVGEARDAMEKGVLEKVVLSRTLETAVDPLLIPDHFENALKEQPEAFVCLVNCPEYGTWMGASPEMLVQVRGARARVDSIAGTLPVVAAPTDPTQWGAKEREEQAMVTRNVLNTFLDLGIKGVSVSGPEVLKAAHVSHLHTLIMCELGHTPPGLLVRSLHPTPAVCGAPRDEAIQVIQKMEPHARSLYAGFWGPWRSGGKSSLYVNIRCMRIMDDRAVLYVGAGITKGSDPEKEWQETEHKALTWLRPLQAMRAGIS